MTRQSLASLRQVFEVQPKKTEQEARQALIAAARAGNAKTIAQQTGRAGIAPSVEQWANTRGNRNIESVKLPGPIVYRYDYRREIAMVALDLVRKASPVQSGRYVSNHILQLNGTEVDVLPANLSEADVITITNPVPYARRIEIGKTKSGRDFVLQVPNRIYERVAKGELSRRYRKAANIQFTYVQLTGAAEIKGKLASHYTVGNFAPGGKHTKRRRRQQKGTQVRAPAIVIKAPTVIPV